MTPEQWIELSQEPHRNGEPAKAAETLLRAFEHAAAAALWFELALDDLKQLDEVVEMASSIAAEDPEWAARMVSEVLRRDPAHAAARAFRDRPRA